MIRLDFPAGALQRSTEITIIPKVAVGDSWLNVELEPAEVIFFKVVTMTLIIADGVDLTDAMLFAGPDVATGTLLPTTVSDRTVTTTLHFFGPPTLGAPTLSPGALGQSAFTNSQSVDFAGVQANMLIEFHDVP